MTLRCVIFGCKLQAIEWAEDEGDHEGEHESETVVVDYSVTLPTMWECTRCGAVRGFPGDVTAQVEFLGLDKWRILGILSAAHGVRGYSSVSQILSRTSSASVS